MNLLRFLFYDFQFYALYFCGFIAIAFFAARYLRVVGVFVGALVISLIVVALEVHSVFDDMRNNPGTGRDADMVFFFGVFVRIIIFNVMLLPASALGLWAAFRRRRAVSKTKTL